MGPIDRSRGACLAGAICFRRAGEDEHLARIGRFSVMFEEVVNMGCGHVPPLILAVSVAMGFVFVAVVDPSLHCLGTDAPGGHYLQPARFLNVPVAGLFIVHAVHAAPGGSGATTRGQALPPYLFLHWVLCLELIGSLGQRCLLHVLVDLASVHHRAKGLWVDVPEPAHFVEPSWSPGTW